jgi:hypothetical protein
MSVFVYGTLLDLVLRERLLGRDVVGKAAELEDYVVLEHKTSPLPALVERDGALTAGLLLDDLTDVEIAKLNAYELPFDYNLVSCAVKVAGAVQTTQTYLAGKSVAISNRDWSLERWQDQSGPLSREMAVEIGSFNPPLSGDALRAQWHMIALRASVRLRARSENTPSQVRYDAQPADFKIENNSRMSGDFFRLAGAKITHRTFQDTTAGPLPREVFIGTDAA